MLLCLAFVSWCIYITHNYELCNNPLLTEFFFNSHRTDYTGYYINIRDGQWGSKVPFQSFSFKNWDVGMPTSDKCAKAMYGSGVTAGKEHLWTSIRCGIGTQILTICQDMVGEYIMYACEVLIFNICKKIKVLRYAYWKAIENAYRQASVDIFLYK